MNLHIKKVEGNSHFQLNLMHYCSYDKDRLIAALHRRSGKIGKRLLS